MNSTTKNVLSIIIIVSVFYFSNKLIRSYLYEQAINSITFTIYDLEDAKTKAAKEGKLVLADYSAHWCPSCRKLTRQVFANPDVGRTIAEQFVYARLDHDTAHGIAFARQYDLFGFPRVLVLRPDGKRLVEMPLIFDPVAYQSNLDLVASTFLTQEQ